MATYLPTLKQLQYLVALKDHGHFGRAAEVCFVTQSTMSAGIRELETLIGVTLVERTRRETLEQMQRPAPISRGDPEFEAEERRLEEARRTMDANSYGWLKWQTDQTRANRATQREAQNALREARDVSDRAAFDRVQTTNPGLYKLYADKVESEVVRLRNAGVQVPGRRDILKYLAGNDLLDGKLKKTTAAPRPSTPSAPTQTIDRGRMPVTRSDVRGRANAASDAEKRAERLRNVNI